MFAALAKLIDWCVIQTTSRRTPPIDSQSLWLGEAFQFLKGPDSSAVQRNTAVRAASVSGGEA